MKPILFSTPMVQAILDGRKTQTRREIPRPKIDDPYSEKYQNGEWYIDRYNKGKEWNFWGKANTVVHNKCGAYIGKEKYSIGDILYVRETWQTIDDTVIYKASEPDWESTWKFTYPFFKWKPSLFMPKASARIFLKVTNVRVERLQDIRGEDAIAEGIEKSDKPNNDYLSWKDYFSNGVCSPRGSYRSLWRSINGKDAWERNPYVFVYEFERVAKPEATV